MVRGLWVSVGSLCLAGCMSWSDRPVGWPHDGAPVGKYDFDWQLSGDPAVAPLQVFSGEGRIWLQFAPGRTPPALFGRTADGMQPLPYRRQDPYVIVDGLWPVLVLRGGHHEARVRRHGPRVAEDTGRDVRTEADARLED